MRTLAQEYGGVAFSVSGNMVIFSNYQDQRLYKQIIGGKINRIWCRRICIVFSCSFFCFSKYIILNIMSVGAPPIPITPDYGDRRVRYADGVIDSNLNRYITVMEG